MKVCYHPSKEIPVSIEGDVVRANWYRGGEGYNGDYDPDDPNDKELLRFDIYKRRSPEHEWEVVDDASYCTYVPANTKTGLLADILMIIYKNFSEVLEEDYEASVKKLGEYLSWIDLEDS